MTIIFCHNSQHNKCTRYSRTVAHTSLTPLPWHAPVLAISEDDDLHTHGQYHVFDMEYSHTEKSHDHILIKSHHTLITHSSHTHHNLSHTSHTHIPPSVPLSICHVGFECGTAVCVCVCQNTFRFTLSSIFFRVCFSVLSLFCCFIVSFVCHISPPCVNLFRILFRIVFPPNLRFPLPSPFPLYLVLS